jgi:hypothetical protein
MAEAGYDPIETARMFEALEAATIQHHCCQGWCRRNDAKLPHIAPPGKEGRYADASRHLARAESDAFELNSYSKPKTNAGHFSSCRNGGWLAKPSALGRIMLSAAYPALR